jgi:hypothetical protein
MTIKSSTTTGSLERFIRTFVQIAVADSAAFPALLAAFSISPTLAAKVIGVVNAIVLAVVAIQNALESKGVVPAMLRTVPAPTSTLTVGAVSLTQPIGTITTPIFASLSTPAGAVPTVHLTDPSVPAAPVAVPASAVAGGPVDPTPGQATQVAS